MLFINQAIDSDTEVSESDFDVRIKRFLVNNGYKLGDTEQLNELFTNSIGNLSDFDDIIKNNLLKIHNIVFSTLSDIAYNNFIKFINDLCDRYSAKLFSFNQCVFRNDIRLENFVTSKSVENIKVTLSSDELVFKRLNCKDSKVIDDYRQPHMIINTSTIPDNIKSIEVDFDGPSSGLLIKIGDSPKECNIFGGHWSQDHEFIINNGKLMLQIGSVIYDVNMGKIDGMYFDEIAMYCMLCYNIMKALTKEWNMSDCLFDSLEHIKSYKIDLNKMLDITFTRTDGKIDPEFNLLVNNRFKCKKNIGNYMQNFLYILNKIPVVNNDAITIEFNGCSEFDIGSIKLPENWNKDITLIVKCENDIVKCNFDIKISKNKDIKVNMNMTSKLLVDNDGNNCIIRKLENVNIAAVPSWDSLYDEYLLLHIQPIIHAAKYSDWYLSIIFSDNNMLKIKALINDKKLFIDPSIKMLFCIKSNKYLLEFINLFCDKSGLNLNLDVDSFMNYNNLYRYGNKNSIDYEKSKIEICIINNSVKVNFELYSSLIENDNLILKSEYDIANLPSCDVLRDAGILWHLNKLINGVRFDRYVSSFFCDDNMADMGKLIDDNRLDVDLKNGIFINIYHFGDNLLKFIGLIADKYAVPLTFGNMDFNDNYNYFISQYTITDIANPKIESKYIKITKLILRNVRNFVIDCALIPDLNIQLDFESQRNCSIINIGAHKSRIDLKELTTGSGSSVSGEYYIEGNTLYDKNGDKYTEWNSWLMDRDIGTCSNIEDNTKELREIYQKACVQIKQFNERIDTYDKCQDDDERMNLIKEVMFGDRLDNYKKCKDYNTKMAFIEKVKSNATYYLKMPSEIKYIESIFGVDNYSKLFEEFDKKIKKIDYKLRDKIKDNYREELDKLKDTEKQNESNALRDNNLKILYGEIDKVCTSVDMLLKNVTDIEYGAIDRTFVLTDGSLTNETKIEYNKEKITQYWSEYSKVKKINFNNKKVDLDCLNTIEYYDKFYYKDKILMDFVSHEYNEKIDSCLKILRNINNILKFKWEINRTNIISNLHELMVKYSGGNIDYDEWAFRDYKYNLTNLGEYKEEITKASEDFDFIDASLNDLINSARDKIDNRILQANGKYRNFVIKCVVAIVVFLVVVCGVYWYISSYVDSTNVHGKFDDDELNDDSLEFESSDNVNDFVGDELNDDSLEFESNDNVNDFVGDDKSN